MLIVSLSLVQSEADIIEYFVRANLLLLDHMVILLNPSEDGTEEILEALVAEGLPLTLWRLPRNSYNQAELITTLNARVSEQLDPEWIVPLDADEILLYEGRAALEGALARLSPGQIVEIPWVSFVPRKALPDRTPFDAANWRQRLTQEASVHVKLAIPRRPDRQDLIIQQGAHRVRDKTGRVLPMVAVPGFEMAHLPARSLAQVAAKTYASYITKGLDRGTQWAGRESGHREAIIDYLGRAENPDSFEIACRYPSSEWRPDFTPDLVKDDRLPRLPLLYSAQARVMPIERHMFFRLAATLFARESPLKARPRSAGVAPKEGPLDWPPFAAMLQRFAPGSLLFQGRLVTQVADLASAQGLQTLPLDETRAGAPQADIGFFELPASQTPIETWVQNVAKSVRKGLVLCPKRPEQGGSALQPAEWLAHFAAQGWQVDGGLSFTFRLLATHLILRRNAFVLRPSAEVKAVNSAWVAHLYAEGLPKEWRRWPAERAMKIGFAGQARGYDLTGRDLPPLALKAERPRSAPLTYRQRLAKRARQVWGKIIPIF